MSAESKDSPYKLCLMRHGIAVARIAGASLDDAKRPLTPDGKNRVKSVAQGLSKAGFVPAWILASPLVRAVETAEIVGESLGSNVPLDFCDALAPGGTPEALLTFLAKHAQRRSVLAVGHEPDLSELAARLLGASRHANLAFKKAGCCLIAFDQFPPKSPGRLLWWLTPRLLRKLA